MSEHVVDDAIAQLTARLDVLRPLVGEASRLQAALTALRGDGLQSPVTALDPLAPVVNDVGAAKAGSAAE